MWGDSLITQTHTGMYKCIMYKLLFCYCDKKTLNKATNRRRSFFELRVAEVGGHDSRDSVTAARQLEQHAEGLHVEL